MKTDYTTDQFSLSLSQHKKEAIIHMQLHNAYVNTRYFPYTLDILTNKLPEVLNTQCFNEENLPFSEEVRATEIGHLYEHILLEYLCQEKLDAGHESVVFNGLTKWNWKKHSFGSFDIYVDASIKDSLFLQKSIEKATLLTDRVLVSPLQTIDISVADFAFQPGFAVAT